MTIASAESGRTTWTGYLYQGPGYRFAVVDELPQASSIDIERCADSWCKVTSGHRVGYLPAEIVSRGSADKPGGSVLAQPAAAPLNARPSGPCFKANQKGGNGGNAMTIFCQK